MHSSWNRLVACSACGSLLEGSQNEGACDGKSGIGQYRTCGLD